MSATPESTKKCPRCEHPHRDAQLDRCYAPFTDFGDRCQCQHPFHRLHDTPESKAAPSVLLDSLASAVVGWHLQAMPDEKAVEVTLKIKEEAGELHDEQALVEAADVFIALVAWVACAGYSKDQFRAAIADKLLVNMARNWEKQPNGTYRHV